MIAAPPDRTIPSLGVELWAGEVTAVELLEAQLARIEHPGPSLAGSTG